MLVIDLSLIIKLFLWWTHSNRPEISKIHWSMSNTGEINILHCVLSKITINCNGKV